MSMIRLLSALVLSVTLLAACEQSSSPPAPLGEQAVLEQLAEAYKETLQSVPSAPRSMRPEGRILFVEQVFRTAGYDYAATLAALAQGMDTKNAAHRDLAELAMLPFSGISDAGMADLLSGEMLENARLLRERLG